MACPAAAAAAAATAATVQHVRLRSLLGRFIIGGGPGRARAVRLVQQTLDDRCHAVGGVGDEGRLIVQIFNHLVVVEVVVVEVVVVVVVVVEVVVVVVVVVEVVGGAEVVVVVQRWW
jgi:hypothetical protein